VKYQNGYTLPELIAGVALAVLLIIGALGIYAIVHFTLKFW
jgi:prepilin-type N-terminal cleavage/methylation domain-containing protein